MNNNNKKILEPIYTLKISDNLIIEKCLYQTTGNTFYEVVLKTDKNEIFIGRFTKELNNLRVTYNNGKILVYYDNFIQEERQMKVIKVLSLYDILDDIFYSCTEEEALNIFNPNIDTNYLEDPDRYIYRSDLEKRKKLQ